MEPQASLPSAAQPTVMDIRRLRRRLLEIPFFKCESSVIKFMGLIGLITLSPYSSPTSYPLALFLSFPLSPFSSLPLSSFHFFNLLFLYFFSIYY